MDGKELNFEPSGGLIHASLVMVDKETDTYWSIMTYEALAGELAGSSLDERSLGVKTQWKDWRREHPDTLVLSVEGKEHVASSPYDNYFASDRVYGGGKLRDERLQPKQTIYGFHHGGKPYAVPFDAYEAAGASFTVSEGEVFLYRAPEANIYASSNAYFSPAGFEMVDGSWTEKGSAARFDPGQGTFVNGDDEASIEHLGGFDTFWFNWSMNNPKTEVLGQ